MLLKKYHLSAADITRVNLNYSEQIAALLNGRSTRRLRTEPASPRWRSKRVLLKNVMGGDQWYPNQEIAVVIYFGDFIENHHDAAQAPLSPAYLRGRTLLLRRSQRRTPGGPKRERCDRDSYQRTDMKDSRALSRDHAKFVNPPENQPRQHSQRLAILSRFGLNRRQRARGRHRRRVIYQCGGKKPGSTPMTTSTHSTATAWQARRLFRVTR